MNRLNDDHYRELFKHLSLNDLMNWRLVSKRFRVLVDSVRIKKLAIFKGVPPIPGKFKLLDEQYGLSDCVHVLSLDSFFKSSTILKCLEQLEKLAIFTWNGGEKNFFRAQFNELSYLEIHCAMIVHPTLLASPKLEKIYYYQAWMNDSHEDSSGLSILLHPFGFDKVVSKRLKHISFRRPVVKPFFEYCVQRGLLNEMEVIEVQVSKLEWLLYIVKNCPKLKKIDAYLCVNSLTRVMQAEGLMKAESVKEIFSDRFSDQQLRTAAKLLKRMNKNLACYLWSLPFNTSTCVRVKEFFSKLGNAIQAIQGSFLLRITNDESYQLLREFDRDNFLDEFWCKVHIAKVQNTVDKAKFCKRLTNCIAFNSFLKKDSDLAILSEAISSMPLQLNDFSFECDFRVQCGNEVLDLLPKHVRYINGLALQCWASINFEFLFNLVGLKTVRLFLAHPMPPSVYLHLVRTRKHLAYFEVYCERSDDQSNEKLSAFKAQVIECLDKELGYKDAVFKIQTFCNQLLHLVRYVMKRNKLSSQNEGACPMDADKKFYLPVFLGLAQSKGIPVRLFPRSDH